MRPRCRSHQTKRNRVRAGRSSIQRLRNFQDVPIYWRGDLAPGARVAGPAVIAEDDTSTIVSALFDARIDRFGYIELIRREA